MGWLDPYLKNQCTIIPAGAPDFYGNANDGQPATTKCRWVKKVTRVPGPDGTPIIRQGELWVLPHVSVPDGSHVTIAGELDGDGQPIRFTVISVDEFLSPLGQQVGWKVYLGLG